MRKDYFVTVFALLVMYASTACISQKPALYGERSCKDKNGQPDFTRVPYVVSGGRAAICLDKKDVAFMLCARELSLITSSSDRGFDFSAKLGLEGVAESELAPSVRNKVQQAWAAEGKLAQARANAINACLEMRK